MATKIIKAWINGAIQEIEVEEMTSPAQPLSVEERVNKLEDKHEVVFTDGNLLVGNGTEELEEMTPEEVLSHINGASVRTMTTAEYEALEESETNANTLYMLTDSEETSVLYTEQSLTDEQKEQARANIGTDIATDDEIIDMLTQEDMLPVVADFDGALLSDENENILLW